MSLPKNAQLLVFFALEKRRLLTAPQDISREGQAVRFVLAVVWRCISRTYGL